MCRTKTNYSPPEHLDFIFENRIDDATATALDHALNKPHQRSLDMVRDTASQDTQIVGVAERLGNLPQNLQDLNARQ